MFVLGFTGTHLDWTSDLATPPASFSGPHWMHDSAAVLLQDGNVVAAIEQERLDRVKHSNRFPQAAIEFCLRQASIAIEDLDAIAYNWDPTRLDLLYFQSFLQEFTSDPIPDTRQALLARFQASFEVEVSEQLRFVPHHEAHAYSAIVGSGFDEGLVVVLDAFGGGASGLIADYGNGALKSLWRIPADASLGHFYQWAIGVIGFREFEEYKVMGLAPYGDPSRFRKEMRQNLICQPEGRFSVTPSIAFWSTARSLYRRPSEPIEQIHKDWAAALQEALEHAVLHVLEHFGRSSGRRDLMLAGGVAHNCSMNGRILRSGLFERVFVQPAAHDAGCALGAAWKTELDLRPIKRPTALADLYWGSPLPEPNLLEPELKAWSDFIEYERPADIHERVAEELANGEVVAWVQGRSEFGPRALGNRSILADPRPADNKARINAMIKKREAYRPFAPAVLENDLAEFFIVPAQAERFPFMISIVDVRPDRRTLLGATTHVDGSARVQTVSRTDNASFWTLIDRFKQKTGIGVLLNTSFNNHAEPIVDSAQDALTTFLTTDLGCLALGDFLIRRRPQPNTVAYGRMILRVPQHVRLVHETTERRRVEWAHQPTRFRRISDRAWNLLTKTDGTQRIEELLESDLDERLLEEILALWRERWISLAPSILDHGVRRCGS